MCPWWCKDWSGRISVAAMNPGDLLLPDPGYPDYLSLLWKIEFETFPLKAENEFLPDLSAIPEDVAKRKIYLYQLLTIPPEPWQRGIYEELSLGKNLMLVWSVTLPMVPWERMVLNQAINAGKRSYTELIHFLKL